MPKVYFCKEKLKQLPFGQILDMCKEVGLVEAMNCMIEVDDTHPLCNKLPADKIIDKSILDEYGLPSIVSKPLPKPLEGIELLEQQTKGAKRSLEYTQNAFLASLAPGAPPLDPVIAAQRSSDYANIEAYLDQTESDYNASLVPGADQLSLSIYLTRKIAQKGVELYNAQSS